MKGIIVCLLAGCFPLAGCAQSAEDAQLRDRLRDAEERIERLEKDLASLQIKYDDVNVRTLAKIDAVKIEMALRHAGSSSGSAPTRAAGPQIDPQTLDTLLQLLLAL